MAQIFTAFASEVRVNDETVEGLQSIEFAESKQAQQVGAIGSDERIAVYFGLKMVTGKLQVASANATLDKLLEANGEFAIHARLRHGETTRNVSLDSCFLSDKSFALAAQGHGETVYSFTAARVREE